MFLINQSEDIEVVYTWGYYEYLWAQLGTYAFHFSWVLSVEVEFLGHV
jgi:hypothetical protein